MIMNNNLFKTLFIPAVACLLGACTESTGPDMEAGDDSLAIRFAGPAVTRAAIDDADDMQTDGNSFSVWGSYTAVTGGTATSVFDAEKVTCLSGMWGYEGTRYWLPGNTYDFYALYPSAETLGDAVSSVACTDGTFTVNGFDATKGYDLMTAKKTGISVVAGQTPGAVALKFQHLLARLTFVARSEGGNATVRSISLEGLAVKGDYDDSAETAWNNTTTGKVSVKKETNVTPAGKRERVGRPAAHSAIACGRGEADRHLRHRCRDRKVRFLHLACHHREHVGGGEPLPLLVHPHRRRLHRVRPAHGQRMERRHRRERNHRRDPITLL